MSHNDSLKKIREEKEKWEEKTLKPREWGQGMGLRYLGIE